MNIKFNYLYRDAGNYKTYGSVVFSNPQQREINLLEEILRKQLIDSQFFDPANFKVPTLKHLDFAYDSKLDHSWNEFESFEITNENISDERTIDEFLNQSFAKP